MSMMSNLLKSSPLLGCRAHNISAGRFLYVFVQSLKVRSIGAVHKPMKPNLPPRLLHFQGMKLSRYLEKALRYMTVEGCRDLNFPSRFLCTR